MLLLGPAITISGRPGPEKPFIEISTQPAGKPDSAGSWPTLNITGLAPTPVPISTLLAHASDFHQKVVTVRGIIKQPELHLDDTHLRFDFVFRLTEGDGFITVFGTHDRTKGPPFIAMDLQVEVVGKFFQERERHSFSLTNTLEAFRVTPYPSPDPDRV
jgi:hypothetical protein